MGEGDRVSGGRGFYGHALSGLRVLKFDGAVAPRVLKFDSGYAAEGCGGAPLNYRRRLLMIKPSQPGFRPWENHTTALRARKRHSPFGGWRHHLSPRSSVGRQKESALMGRLGALLRPTWRSYAGPPQWHYKAPLCCERLMKGLLFRALLSHHTVGGRWCRKAPKGGKPPEVADRRNVFHAI